MRSKAFIDDCAVQANWEAYVAEEVQELPHGHLVPYPVAVEPDGFVTTLPGHRNFPDTKGSILGAVMKVKTGQSPPWVASADASVQVLISKAPIALQVPKFLRNALGNYVTT